MNANRWPLNEMQQLRYDVPLTLMECQSRIEGLDEAEIPLLIAREFSAKWSRTRVLIVRDPSIKNVYCLQRVPRDQKAVRKRVYAEVNLGLVAFESGTHVTVYFSDAQTKAEQDWKKGQLFKVALMALVSVMGLLKIGWMVAAVLVVLLPLIVYRVWQDAHYFRQQRDYLLNQIHTALNTPTVSQDSHL